MDSTHPTFPEELVPMEDLFLDLEKRKHVALRRFHMDFNTCGEPIQFAPDRFWSAKPLVQVEKQALFAEVALLSLFRKSGWEGVWADGSHRKYFDKMPNQSKGVSLTTYVNKMLTRIAEANGQSRTGCWDVILWSHRTLLFVAVAGTQTRECRPSAPSGLERPRAAVSEARARWLDAALRTGLSAGQFVVVQWDYRRVIVRRKRPLSG
jgi:hypothetical protein